MSPPPGTLERLDRLFLVDLTSIRDTYFALLIWSTVVVAVGVVMEGPEIVQEVIEEIKTVWRRRLMKRQTPGSFLPSWVMIDSKPAPWIKLVAFAGWILVIGGIVGEGVFEADVSIADGLIQTFNGRLLSEARDRAANANARAGEAIEEAAGFQAQIAASDARTKSAEARIAEAQQYAAEAQSMARNADLARAQLEERIAPRTLTVAQREYIGRKLGIFARRFFARKIKLDWPTADIEPTIFAIEVEDSLKRGFIDVERPTTTTIGGPIHFGIAITGPPRDIQFVKALYFILSADFPGEAMTLDARPTHQLEPVTVTIGVKTPEGLDTLPPLQTSGTPR